MARIKNINGIEIDNCSCGNWLKHWNKHNNKPAVFCSEISCTQMANLEGIHVQKVTDDSNWYIVPLCKEHHTRTGELEINDFIQFIDSNKTEICNQMAFIFK